MTERSHWRKVRPISLSSEDNARLERLRTRAGEFILEPSYSLLVRVALRELEKLPRWKLQAALESVPPTRYGPERKTPRPTLSEEERRALLEECGLI
jgi:hypothetical protein